VSLWQIALTIFLVANPIGNTPAFVALVKNFPFERQKKILFRESLFSFFIALFFLFIGEQFLKVIQVKQYAVSVSGGTLLFLVALNMIFPPKDHAGEEKKPQEPFIVPIATPLISGGGVLSTIMIFSAKEPNTLLLTLAVTIAYVAVVGVVVSAAYLNRLLGEHGLLALEQLMGMILAMISTEIIVKGVLLFAQTYHAS
jgi:multiple antibiotic resistance protein